ncbi:TPA: hypothetical protein SMI73_001482 [Klebsiella oxytoca]|nr:hypothetical protein [Klebsiella oxytoca]
MRYEFSGLQAATLKILLADNQQRLSAYSALQQGSTILNLPDIEAEFSKEDFNMLFSAIWPQENSEVAK